MQVNWNNVVSPSRNDIVFDGRNQSYGAFELRRKYSETVMWIVVGLIATTVLIIATKFILDLKGADAIDANVKLDMTQIDLTPPVDKSEPPPPPPPPPPPVMETVKFVPPVIKDDATEEEPPPPQEKLAETTVSTVTQEGSGDEVVVPSDGGNGPIEEKAPEIFTVVEQMPEFPGGMAELNKYLLKNISYPQVEKEAGIMGKCYVKFVVEPDGSISNAEVLRGVTGGPGCDKEALRVVKSMPKWSAGKQNGRSVRVYFNLPVNFKLN